MEFDPSLHRRRSIRLRGYDYARSGAYFVTICVQDRHCLFGDIRDGEAVLSDAGRMIKRWWHEIGAKFSLATAGDSVVMPNHFHGIVVITASDTPDDDPVGTALRGRHSSTIDGTRAANYCQPSEGAHAGAPLPEVVQWFKTMTTNEYIRGVKDRHWRRFAGRLWQRNYYERIIRSEEELQTIRQYIIDNPRKWPDDPNNPAILHMIR
jgi:REP element-mobilizing transposase RayT